MRTLLYPRMYQPYLGYAIGRARGRTPGEPHDTAGDVKGIQITETLNPPTHENAETRNASAATA